MALWIKFLNSISKISGLKKKGSSKSNLKSCWFLDMTLNFVIVFLFFNCFRKISTPLRDKTSLSLSAVWSSPVIPNNYAI